MKKIVKKKPDKEENVLVVLKEHIIKKEAILGAIVGVLIFLIGFFAYDMFIPKTIISDDFSSYDKNTWHYVQNSTGEESYNVSIDDGMLKIPKNTIGTEPFIVSKTFTVNKGKTISIDRDLLINTTEEQDFIAYFVLSSVSDEGSPQDIFYIEYINSDSAFEINVCVVEDESLTILETLSFPPNEEFSEAIDFNTSTGMLTYKANGDSTSVTALVPETNEFALYMFGESEYDQGDMLVDNIVVKTN
ncbi:MAG: hypothetical protein R2876_05630 [Eubacteriales bacterium]